MIAKYVCIIGFLATISLPVSSQPTSQFPPSERPDTRQIDPDKKIPEFNLSNPLSIPSGIDQDKIDPDLELQIGSIEFKGNRSIPDQEIESVLSPFIGRIMKVKELSEIEVAVTQLYESKKYLGSGAFVFDNSQPFNVNNATIPLQIVERAITSITVDGSTKESKRLVPYVRTSLGNLIEKPLNEDELTNELRFLLLKQSIEGLKANIEPTEFIDEASLSLEVEAGDILTGVAVLNDKRSPTIGSIERGGSLINRNVSRRGDEIQVDYRNTDGSNLVALSYQIPVNALDGRVSLNYLFTDSSVTQIPLDQLDLRSVSHTIGASFRQPVFRSSSNTHLTELVLGIGLSRYSNQDWIGDVRAPLSNSANENGATRSLVVNAFQEFFSQTESDTVRVLSDFAYGIPAGTTNDAFFGNGDFFKFSVDAEYSHQFSDLLSSTTRLRGQLVDRDVILNENFFLGGSSSVRGYRPAALSFNNGMSIAQELPIIIFNRPKDRLEFVPFLDFGIGSNLSSQIFESTETLASTGFVIRYRLLGKIFTSFEFAQPLFGDRNSRGSQVNFDFQWRI